MNAYLKRTIVITLLMVAAPACVGGPRPEAVPTVATVKAGPRFEAIREEIIARVRAGDVPSVSVAVAQGGVLLWEESIGWASTETKKGATPTAAYTGASIAKTLTAVGVLTLVDDGVLSLDEPAVKYLQDGDLTPLAADPQDVTIRRLITMTAGLPQGFRSYQPPERAETTRAQLRAHGGLLPRASDHHTPN